MQAVVIAGGKGTRLYPLTKNIPKALIPIEETPILEIIVRQLSHHGFTELVFATNHMHDQIYDYFGDGTKFDVSIDYSKEEIPLGTAGPISLLERLTDDILVINCDIFSDVDFGDFVMYHKSENNTATILSVKKEEKYPYGVIKIIGETFEDIIEKPTLSFKIYGGAAVLNQQVIRELKRGEPKEMPDLLRDLKVKGHKIGIYDFSGMWIDIGNRDSYTRALELANVKSLCFNFGRNGKYG